ncbi:uncharacterized protein [Ptychodera flava]|uniref:uncharacterized protein n=1 Tax=Ptychodera flava TaxID=63121 RepID=UPI00396A0FAD
MAACDTQDFKDRISEIARIIPEEHYDVLWNELQISDVDVQFFEEFKPPEKAQHILTQWIEDQEGSCDLLITALDKIGLPAIAAKVKSMVMDTQDFKDRISEIARIIPGEHYDVLWNELQISDDDVQFFEEFKPPEKAQHILTQWIEDQEGSCDLLITALDKIGLPAIAAKVKRIVMEPDYQKGSSNFLGEAASTAAKFLKEDDFGKLWQALNISDDDVEFFNDFEPTERATNILKLWLEDSGITGLDRLVHCVKVIGLDDIAKDIRSKLAEIIASDINEVIAEELWELLGMKGSLVRALDSLPVGQRNKKLINRWMKNEKNTFENLIEKVNAAENAAKEDQEKSTTKGYKAIPLCYPDNYVWNKADNTLTQRTRVSKGKLKLNDDALSVLEHIDQPVCLVSIVGDSCTGKSYILNQLQSDMEKRCTFGVSASLKGFTKGLWMSGKPISQTLSDGTEVAVIFIDSEGLDSLEASKNEQLFVLAVLISSLLIYNCKNITKPEASTKLRYFGTLASNIKVNKKDRKDKVDSDDFFRLFPDLFWLLRDTTSRLTIDVKGDVKKVETKDYILLEILNSDKDSVREGKIKRDILDHFPVFDAIQLPIPSFQEDIIAKLNDIGDLRNVKGINPEFARGIANLGLNVDRMMKPKKMWPQVGKLYGSHLALFLRSYVSKINYTDSTPCIASLWEDVTKSLLDAAMKKANIVYENEFGPISSSKKKPCDEMEILEKYDNAFCKAMDFYTDETRHINDATLRMKYLRKLKDIIAVFEKDTATIKRGTLYKILVDNAAVSESYCRDVLEKLMLPSFEEDARLTSVENITKMIIDPISEYYTQAIGPKKVEVLQEHLIKKMKADETLPENPAYEEGHILTQVILNWRRMRGEERKKKMTRKIDELTRQGEHTFEQWRKDAKKEQERVQRETVRLMRYAADLEEKAWDIYFSQQNHHRRLDDEEIQNKQKQNLTNSDKIYKYNAAKHEEEWKQKKRNMNTDFENKRKARDRNAGRFFDRSERTKEEEFTTTKDQESTVLQRRGDSSMHPMMAFMEVMRLRDEDARKAEQENLKMVFGGMCHQAEENRKTMKEIHERHEETLKEAQARREEHYESKYSLLFIMKAATDVSLSYMDGNLDDVVATNLRIVLEKYCRRIRMRSSIYSCRYESTPP